jgi:uncharacterized protein
MRVLAVSGGGAQGMYAACVLEGVEARVGPLGGVLGAAAGTSIGAALAAGVALGVPVAEMRAAFREQAPRIFKPLGVSDPRIEKAMAAARGAARPRHRTDPWRETLESLLGGARLRDARIPLSIPALNLTEGGHLDIFRSHPLSGADPDPDTPVVEAVLASSAAPTFFKPHRWNGTVYADGGMASNAPDAILLAETWARTPGVDLAMLSIGTGLSFFASDLDGDLDWGLAQWARANRLASLAMAASQNGPLTVARTALGARHHRMDTAPTLEERRHIGIDCATIGALYRLEQMARRVDWAGFEVWWAGLPA